MAAMTITAVVSWPGWSAEAVDGYLFDRDVLEHRQHRNLVGRQGGERFAGDEGAARVRGEDLGARVPRGAQEAQREGGQVALVEDIGGEHHVHPAVAASTGGGRARGGG